MKREPRLELDPQQRRLRCALESIDEAIAQLDLRADVRGLARLRADVASALQLAREPAR
jgi:hypothetical protein